jgi:dTDP-4-amino-4,6-dideoxygalactose transaminase
MQVTWTISDDTRIPLEEVRARLNPLLPQIHEGLDRIVKTGKYVYGRFSDQLEAALKEAWEVEGQVVLTKSGTDALTLAAWAAGFDDGIGANGEDHPVEILCPNLTFPSSATAITVAGLLRRNTYRLVFVDVDPSTLNMDPQAVEGALTSWSRALVVPHLYGNPAAMERLLDLARRHDLKLIEDTSQAHGARYQGHFVGTLGHAAAGSLYAYKNLGGLGDLGYLVVPDEQTRQQALRHRDLGRDPGNRNLFHGLGLRTRPEEVNALAALTMLPYLEKNNARARNIVAYYRKALLDTPVRFLDLEEGSESVYWRCTLLLSSTEVRDAFCRYLASRQIGSEIVYPFPVSEHGMYRNGLGDFPCRVAESGTPHAYDAASRLVCIPCWPQMSDGQVERVAEVIRTFFQAEWRRR